MEILHKLQRVKEKHTEKEGDAHPTHELENFLTAGVTSWGFSAPDSSHPLYAWPSHHGGHESTQRIDRQGSHSEYKSPLTEVLSPWVWDGNVHSRPPSLLLNLKLNRWTHSVGHSLVSRSLLPWRAATCCPYLGLTIQGQLLICSSPPGGTQP